MPDERAGRRVRNLEVTQLAISSTDIRNQLAAGRDPRFLLPATVLAYIRKHGLYVVKALTQTGRMVSGFHRAVTILD
jgi:nicotinic acid mononucleotide adenylyltransferase